MNIKIRNKIVTVLFEQSDKVQIANYDSLVEEIVKDSNNGATKFIFDFIDIKDSAFDSSIIGLVSGLSKHLKKKNALVVLKDVSDHGKDMISMCGFDQFLKFI